MDPVSAFFDFFSLRSYPEVFHDRREQIVAGFLNLKESEGWKEGGYSEVGYKFSEELIKRYFQKNQEILGKDKAVFKSLCSDLDRDTNAVHELLSQASIELPSSCIRSCTKQFHIDSKFQGWKKHAVGRITGRLSQSGGKCFEILVNSHQDEFNICHPFKVHIFKEKQDLEKRSKELKRYDEVEGEEAKHFYFREDLSHPKNCPEASLNADEKNIIRGLNYLEGREMNPQIAGNCWLKQPLRCMLVRIYLEIIKTQRDTSYEDAWKKSNFHYYKILCNEGLPLVESLLESCSKNETACSNAKKAIETRRETYIKKLGEKKINESGIDSTFLKTAMCLFLTAIALQYMLYMAKK